MSENDRQEFLTARVARSLAEVDPAAWNALGVSSLPYLRHEFLNALETEGCVGPELGWLPRHLLVEDSDHRLVAACPMYRKYNSFGEFVFDWTWAAAYERAGLPYYPKLVVAAPFTPATGPRLLVHPAANPAAAELLVDAALEVARIDCVSSLHWLFATDPVLLRCNRLLRRVGCQFHWENRDYGSFEDFLADLTSKRRKEIRRERNGVKQAGVALVRLRGDEVPSEIWPIVYRFYQSTFEKHGNYPALTEAFFSVIAQFLGPQILVVLALRGGAPVAAAFFLVGGETLYGRYWGCQEDIPGLHFEACYYQGIEFCIERGLSRFEPGAQGEHKVSRGFRPTRTWSLHWISDERFQSRIAEAVTAEERGYDGYIARLEEHLPFRRG